MTNRSILLVAAAAAIALAGCQREPESNANEVAADVPETPVANAGNAAAGAEPVGAAQIAVATKEPFGEYLVDSDGRSLYVLEGTRIGQDGGGASKECTGACLGEWPPLMTSGPTGAAQGIDQSLLGTMPRENGQQVTYAGWPLYYYVGDRDAGSTSGQDLRDQWGEWYLLSPQGEIVHATSEEEGADQ